jgi:hypothetical protein
MLVKTVAVLSDRRTVGPTSRSGQDCLFPCYFQFVLINHPTTQRYTVWAHSVVICTVTYQSHYRLVLDVWLNLSLIHRVTTVYSSLLHTLTLLSTVTSSMPLLGSGFRLIHRLVLDLWPNLSDSLIHRVTTVYCSLLHTHTLLSTVHNRLIDVSPTHQPDFTPQKHDFFLMFPVLISDRGWVNPRA